MKEIITSAASECVAILIPVILAVVIRGINAVAKEAKEKAALVKEQNSQAFLMKAISTLEDITTKTVTSIEQTTAATLRDEVKNGTVDRQALCNLSCTAYNDVVKQLKSEYKDAITEGVADFEMYLNHLIESKVFELKTKKNTSGN